MKITPSVSLFLLSLLAAACAKAPPPTAAASAAPSSAGPPAQPAPCASVQFRAGNKCYDSSAAACAALGCPLAKCVVLETAPAKVHCER